MITVAWQPILVVMKDGRIQQAGTPFEAYKNPATTFVARFIGSPGMNIVQRSDIGASLGEFPTLPSEHNLIRFRPEAIKLGRTDSGGLKMNGEIQGIEVLGLESLVHLHLPGAKDTLIAQVTTDQSLPVTGPIEFEVDVSDLHSFDR